MLFVGIAAAAALRAGAQEPRPLTADELFERRDANGDGRITPEELPKEAAFRVLDRNGDGAITRAEAEAQLKARQAGAPGPGQPGAKPGDAPAPELPAAELFEPRPHGEEAAAARLRPEPLAKIDVELQRHLAAKNAAGFVALINRGGVRGYTGVFGSSTLEGDRPLAADAIFRWGGLSRPVIAAAALALADAGAFTLDEPLGRRCPEWAAPAVLESGRAVPARRALTPRLLMSYACGLADPDVEEALSKPVAPSGAATLQPVPGIGTTLKEYSEALARKPLAFQPGAGFSRGPEFDVLGRYLEAVSGKPLDALVRDLVLRPLKMEDTDFWAPPEKSARLCKALRTSAPVKTLASRDDDAFAHKPSLLLVSRGLCGTAGDFERFCLMLLGRGQLDGARVLKPASVELLYPLAAPATPGALRGLSGVADADAYAWGGALAQFALDRQAQFAAIYFAQAQLYKPSAYQAFRALAFEAAGLGVAPVAGGLSADATIKLRDRDGDGKLARAEYPTATFTRIDADQDGFVTAEELRAFWKKK
jgi:CubicO group peptidase (beta-lactamase class C family)